MAVNPTNAILLFIPSNPAVPNPLCRKNAFVVSSALARSTVSGHPRATREGEQVSIPVSTMPAAVIAMRITSVGRDPSIRLIGSPGVKPMGEIVGASAERTWSLMSRSTVSSTTSELKVTLSAPPPTLPLLTVTSIT